MIQVMLDLETMSTRSHAAMASIGAIKFSVQDGIIDEFYRTVDLKTCKAAGLHFCSDTIAWWKQQSTEAQRALLKDNQPLERVLDDFDAWYGTRSLPTWGNGAGFDNVIVENAYRALNRRRPWRPWEDRCYRTMKNIVQIEESPRQGTYHNALDDARHQTLHLLKILGS